MDDKALLEMASRRSRERENASLPADVARCPGVGDEEGWREGCCDCLRRTAPPIDHPHVPTMEPPPIIAFWCEYHISPNRCPNTGDMFDGEDDGSASNLD